MFEIWYSLILFIVAHGLFTPDQVILIMCRSLLWMINKSWREEDKTSISILTERDGIGRQHAVWCFPRIYSPRAGQATKLIKITMVVQPIWQFCNLLHPLLYFMHVSGFIIRKVISTWVNPGERLFSYCSKSILHFKRTHTLCMVVLCNIPALTIKLVNLMQIYSVL